MCYNEIDETRESVPASCWLRDGVHPHGSPAAQKERLKTFEAMK